MKRQCSCANSNGELCTCLRPDNAITELAPPVARSDNGAAASPASPASAAAAASAALRSGPQPVSGVLAWISAFMLGVSMINGLFRPDPTVVVCVLGIYAGGRDDSSPATIAAFALAISLTVVTDTIWWFTDDTILVRSMTTADEFNQLPRTLQMPVCLTALSMVYKVVAIPFSLAVSIRGCQRLRAR
mmetsp:Transcript_11958/g.30126  ORF Transcript_11958/g.30126 Transcript_11958/m.30126 type:complete len:188 (-) Transcript_11958:246-809(-)